MKLSMVAGATSQTVNVFVQDSSSTTGAGLTGLVFNSSGLTAYYAFPRAAAVQITLVTLAAVTSAYSSGGFKEIDATNMPGWYRLDLPNAAIASGNGRFVSVHLKGATNMAPLPLEIELTGWDNQDAVRGGLAALPNATAGATNGLPLAVDNAGRVDVLKVNGTTQTARDIGASVLLSVGTGAGQVNVSGGKVPATLAAADVTGNLPADLQTIKTQTVTCAAGVTVMASVGTAATSTAQTGDCYARLGAPAGLSISADVAAVKSDTGGLRTDYTTARAAKLDNLDATISSRGTFSGGAVASVTAAVSITGDLSATMKTSVENAVWEATAASHNNAGTMGLKVNSAASAGDPWSTLVPGAYAAGTAGYILGHFVQTPNSYTGQGAGDSPYIGR